MFTLLKTSMIKAPSEEDPDEGIKDLVEIALKKMVIFLKLYFKSIKEVTSFIQIRIKIMIADYQKQIFHNQ